MLIEIVVSDGGVKIGSRLVRGRPITCDGCNEPLKDRFWCPKKKWLFKECCPFFNRRECESFKRICCGVL